MTTPKVSLYSLSDLKNTLDDHLPIFLTSPNLLSTSGPALPKSLRFTQSHIHTYVRLILGYTAVAIAAYLFYLDWYLKVPFSSHKRIAAPAALVYFILNTALQAWIWFAERGIVFAGTRKDGKALTLRSRQPHRKYDPVYRLTVASGADAMSVFSAAAQGKELELTAPFARFFAADGMFVPSAFETWLKESIPLLAASSGGGKTAATAPANAAAPQIQVDSSSAAERMEEEDAVLVDSSHIEGVQASSRDMGGMQSGGKKRPKKKA